MAKCRLPAATVLHGRRVLRVLILPSLYFGERPLLLLNPRLLSLLTRCHDPVLILLLLLLALLIGDQARLLKLNACFLSLLRGRARAREQKSGGKGAGREGEQRESGEKDSALHGSVLHRRRMLWSRMVARDDENRGHTLVVTRKRHRRSENCARRGRSLHPLRSRLRFFCGARNFHSRRTSYRVTPALRPAEGIPRIRATLWTRT